MADRRQSGRDFGDNLRSRDGWRDAGRDVEEELRLHAELRARDLEQEGLSPEEACTESARRSGSVAPIRNAASALAQAGDRNARRMQWLEELAQDVRYSVRTLVANPSFSAVALLTIALGLGANAAIFSVVNGAFFRPLPFAHADRLVRVREYTRGADGSVRPIDASVPLFEAIREHPLFEAAAGMRGLSLSLGAAADGAAAERVAATEVAPGWADSLGVRPITGRAFSPEEERTGREGRVVLISHRSWQTRFGAAPEITRKSMMLDGSAYSIVGVMPPGFNFPYESDLWLPARFAPRERGLVVFARLKPGVTMPRVTEALTTVSRQLNQDYYDVLRGAGLMAVPARESLIGDDGRVAVALMGAVGFLLLIACANVAMLMTARFTSRQKEVALRAALGCGRLRQLRQFVVESVVLFMAGGGIGLLVASWLTGSLAVFVPRTLNAELIDGAARIDSRVALFALVLSLVAGIGFGLIASTRASGADLNTVMKDAARGGSPGAGRRTLSILVASEIALALVLLTGAALMIETFTRLQDRDVGFDTQSLLTVQVDLSSPRYAAGPSREAYLAALLERVRATPGVRHAGATTVNALCCGDTGAFMSVEGQPQPRDATAVTNHRLVAGELFAALGVRLLEGRDFASSDVETAAPVVIVDQRFARRYWPGQTAIGKRVKRGPYSGERPWMTVVGVVSPVEDAGDYSDTWYLPYGQDPAGPAAAEVHLMIRADNPLSLIASIRHAAAVVDPAVPLFAAAGMDAIKQRGVSQQRLGAVVAGLFAAAGLSLAVLGVYGLMSYAVSRDRREIGIRLALGATPRALLQQVIGRGIRTTVAGLAAGAVTAWLSARTLRSVLTDVSGLDATLLGAAAVTLLAAATLAALLPALRALRVDPLRALRAD